MEPPGITRHRQPFLAPVWITLLALIAAGAGVLAAQRRAGSTMVFVVQPAESEPGAITDAPVSPEGEARAERLALMFGDPAGAGRVQVVFESDDRRTLRTAAPLVQRLRRAPVVFAATAAQAVAARILREHPGGTVLVIAPGALAGQVMAALLGSDGAVRLDSPDTVCAVSVPTFGRPQLACFKL